MTISKKQALVNAGKALYGKRWQTDLARDLGFSDARRIRQWMSDDRPIPNTITKDLNDLLTKKMNVIDKAIKEIKNAQ
jgi:hypothetical protein